ncbi:hypothetical protein FACS1894195_1050 [Bacteroidia bacterium]|nr:hypothetical protein FACS1894195_1050 [Bacteroidia bacterium]
MKILVQDKEVAGQARNLLNYYITTWGGQNPPLHFYMGGDRK